MRRSGRVSDQRCGDDQDDLPFTATKPRWGGRSARKGRPDPGGGDLDLAFLAQPDPDGRGRFRPMAHRVCCGPIGPIAVVQMHAPGSSPTIRARRRHAAISLRSRRPPPRRSAPVEPDDVDVSRQWAAATPMQVIPYRAAHESGGHPAIRQGERPDVGKAAHAQRIGGDDGSQLGVCRHELGPGGWKRRLALAHDGAAGARLSEPLFCAAL